MSAVPSYPGKIMQIGMGFFASKALLSAVELGVFEALAACPLRGDALRERIGIHDRSAFDFFDALVALGLLERTGDGPDARYANTGETATFLDPKSPFFIGGILMLANNRLYRDWHGLSAALRTGSPQNELKDAGDGDLFGSLYADERRLREFLAAMAGSQLCNFHALAERFDFSAKQVLCDVGGASGALSLVVAGHHRAIRCISFDLPAVTSVARKNISAAGLDGRVSAVSGDFMTDSLPEAEVITMGNILHDWGTGTKKMLIRKAYEALPGGGAFIAIEDIIDEGRRENVRGLLMSLNMLVETPEGYNYTFSQYADWCREAGFRSTERVPLAGTASAAIAWK